LQIDPVYFHASYLVNLADDGHIGLYSKKSLINELKLAFKLGIVGSMFILAHIKIFNFQFPIFINSKYKVLINNIKEVLEKTQKKLFLLLKTPAIEKLVKL
jgi:deoxyribonuclease-4